MAEPPPPRPGDDDPEVADASWLAREEPGETRPPEPAVPAGHGAPEESYDLEPPAERGARPTVPPTPPPQPARPKAAEGAEARRPPSLEPSQAVEQVWSRSAEWGPTLVVLAGCGLGVAALVYVMLSLEWFGLAVLSLLAGGAALAVLSYPILITLERPVRVTPEQAVKDYYGALSHHVPHFRRMWLLLSTAGRTSGSFASLEGFTHYWNSRLEQLRGDRVGRFTPLKFRILDFKSDKSSGASEVDATFRVEVSVRGRLDEGPIATVPVSTRLVRGPDRMWYLDNGTLPSARA
jgi:hypothetical protein